MAQVISKTKIEMPKIKSQIEYTVRLMRKQNQFKVELVAPNPSILKISELGLIFVRGNDPQDDSIFKEQSNIELRWDNIIAIKCAWFNSAIKIVLRSESQFAPHVWVQWLSSSKMVPYNPLLSGEVLDALKTGFKDYKNGLDS